MKQPLQAKNHLNEHLPITYYCTFFFTILGTVLVAYLLISQLQLQHWFTIVLAVSAGGLPIGLIGVLLDYKLAVHKKQRQRR